MSTNARFSHTTQKCKRQYASGACTRFSGTCPHEAVAIRYRLRTLLVSFGLFDESDGSLLHTSLLLLGQGTMATKTSTSSNTGLRALARVREQAVPGSANYFTVVPVLRRDWFACSSMFFDWHFLLFLSSSCFSFFSAHLFSLSCCGSFSSPRVVTETRKRRPRA